MEERVDIQIPTTLYKKIEELIKDTEFGSVEDYVVFVMRNVIAEVEEEQEDVFSEEEEEKVKERLRALGYID